MTVLENNTSMENTGEAEVIVEASGLEEPNILLKQVFLSFSLFVLVLSLSGLRTWHLKGIQALVGWWPLPSWRCSNHYPLQSTAAAHRKETRRPMCSSLFVWAIL